MNSSVAVLTKIPNLLKELIRIVPDVTFHEVLNSEKDKHFKESEILICDFDLLGPHIYNLPKAKWVQGTWAGIDLLVPFVKDSNVPFQITRFTGEHFGKIMGEYVVANIVNHERNFFQVKKHQEMNKWSREGKIFNYRIISDLTVGILSIGNIGNRIGQILHCLGAKILAFGRRAELPSGEGYSHIAKYYRKETLASFLKESDYVINVLPNTTETKSLLDNDILHNCSEKQTVFVNIGRSNVISESSIIKALNNKWLSAVILDVFDTEPLPKDSPLWKHEQVFITPHVAGVSRAKDIASQFNSNLQLYKNNQPLPAIIDFNKGY